MFVGCCVGFRHICFKPNIVVLINSFYCCSSLFALNKSCSAWVWQFSSSTLMAFKTTHSFNPSSLQLIWKFPIFGFEPFHVSWEISLLSSLFLPMVKENGSLPIMLLSSLFPWFSSPTSSLFLPFLLDAHFVCTSISYGLQMRERHWGTFLHSFPISYLSLCHAWDYLWFARFPLGYPLPNILL